VPLKSGSYKVIENDAIQQTIYDFLLVYLCNYSYHVPLSSYLTFKISWD